MPKLETAQTQFHKKVKSKLMKICREYQITEIPKEQIKADIRDKLCVLMISSFSDYLETAGWQGNKDVFKYENGQFKLALSADVIKNIQELLRDTKGYNADGIQTFMEFLAHYPEELTQQFDREADALTKLVVGKEDGVIHQKNVQINIDEIGKKIDNLADTYQKHLGDMAYSLLCITCIGALITGMVFLNASGVIPITVLTGTCTSSMFFLLSHSEILSNALSSVPAMISVSHQMNEYEMQKEDLNSVPNIDEADKEALEKIFEERTRGRNPIKLDSTEQNTCLLADILQSISNTQHHSPTRQA